MTDPEAKEKVIQCVVCDQPLDVAGKCENIECTACEDYEDPEEDYDDDEEDDEDEDDEEDYEADDEEDDE